MVSKKPIFIQLLIKIVLPIVILYSCTLVFVYHYNKQNTLHMTQEFLFELVQLNANKINTEFAILAQTSKVIKDYIELTYPTDIDELNQFITRQVEDHQISIGAGFAFAPQAYDLERDLISYFIHIDAPGQKPKLTDLTEYYDYRNLEWYIIPQETDKTYWTQPFWGIVMKDVILLNANPIKINEQMLGVTYANISLNILSKIVESIKVQNGYAFIITNIGTFVYHPNYDWVMSETIFSLAQQYDRPDIRKLGQKMLSYPRKEDKTSSLNGGIYSYKDLESREKKWVAFTTIETTGWTYATVFTEKDILPEINRFIYIQTLIMIIGLILLLLIIWSRYIKDFTFLIREKESIESEIRIARQIQEATLPRKFPPFPARTEFDLYAVNIPAMDVGGDFYDFYFLDDHTLVLSMADVSGKGISAGLFMAISKSLIKMVCSMEADPKSALEKANNLICIENNHCMFVTVFLAFYDTRDGRFSYANAGHPCPFVINSDGDVQKINAKPNIAMGVLENAKYTGDSFILAKNETIVFYTDGITDAMDKNLSLFGEKRFIEILRHNASLPLDEIIHQVTKDVNSHQKDEQFDDITLLLFKRNI